MSTLSETPSASSSSVSAPASNSHLSFYKAPTPERSASPQPETESNSAPQQRELSKTRLYVGNLHSSVDEYTFLQVFNKFGKVSKLDFLFHKAGPSKGKPRGYAFVEYKEKEDALKALVNAHDKLLRGRKLVVTYANQAPTYETAAYSAGGGKPHRRGEPQRPTTLSLIKQTSHRNRTEDKIAALEAKLNQMKQSSSSSNTSSSLPSHPSLPLKPPPSIHPTNSSTNNVSSPAPTSTSTFAKEKKPSAVKAVKPGGAAGIFASGSSNSLGKKPTLEELMKSRKVNGGAGGLLKR